MIEALRRAKEQRDAEKAFEEQHERTADDRYWEAEKRARDESILEFYKHPFPNLVQRFDEAMVLGEQYEAMLDRSIGYYLMTVARLKYLQTVKSE